LTLQSGLNKLRAEKSCRDDAFTVADLLKSWFLQVLCNTDVGNFDTFYNYVYILWFVALLQVAEIVLIHVQAEWQSCSSSPSQLSTETTSSVVDPARQSLGRGTRTSPRRSSPAVSKTSSPLFTAVRFPPASRQPSLSTTVTGAARVGDQDMPVVPDADDVESMSAAVGRKSKSTLSKRRISLPLSEPALAQVSTQTTEDMVTAISESVDDSYADISPELSIVGPLPQAGGTKTASDSRKFASRRSDQASRSSYTLRTRHSTADGGVQRQIPVPSPAVFLTPPGNADKGRGSDVTPFQSEGHGRRQKSRDAECEAEPNSSNTDYTSMFPLPPQITRVCTDLKFLGSDSEKDSIATRLRSQSGGDSSINETTEKVSGMPDVSEVPEKNSSESKSVIVADTSEVSSDPDQPLSSRLRRRSSEDKSDVESGAGKVSSSPDKQLSSGRRSRTGSGYQSPDVFEDSPVSSPCTVDVAASAVSPTKSSVHSSNTPTKVSSSGLELRSRAECSLPKKSASASPSSLKSDNVCRISDDTSVPRAFDLMTSPQSSPVSSSASPGRLEQAQWRASFRLVVNLKSPKSEQKRRSSTSSLEDADYWSDRLRRSMSPSSSTPSRSQQAGSSRSQRARPSRRNALPSENPTRRSLRLVAKNPDAEPSSTSPAKTATVDTSTAR